MMISQLFGTEIRANQGILFGFTLTQIVLFLLISVMWERSGAGEVFSISLLISMGFGAIIHTRGQQEKRLRLYAQLPVTGFQITMANWCFRLLFLSIPAFLWLILGLLPIEYFRPLESEYFYLKLLGDIFVFYCVAISLLASISISYRAGNQPDPASRYLKWTWLLPFVWLLFILWLEERYGGVLALNGSVRWLILLSVTAPPAVVLLVADIFLHNEADNYLGNL